MPIHPIDSNAGGADLPEVTGAALSSAPVVDGKTSYWLALQNRIDRPVMFSPARGVWVPSADFYFHADSATLLLEWFYRSIQNNPTQALGPLRFDKLGVEINYDRTIHFNVIRDVGLKDWKRVEGIVDLFVLLRKGSGDLKLESTVPPTFHRAVVGLMDHYSSEAVVEGEKLHSALLEAGVNDSTNWETSSKRLAVFERLSKPDLHYPSFFDKHGARGRRSAKMGGFYGELPETPERDEAIINVHDFNNTLVGFYPAFDEAWRDSILALKPISFVELAPPREIGAFIQSLIKGLQAQTSPTFPIVWSVAISSEAHDLHFVSIVQKTLFQKVVDNFLQNAVRYGRGTIHVTVRVEKGELFVIVADKGIGMARDFIETQFGRFGVRAPEAMAQVAQGKGVGVNGALQRLKIVGGKMGVDSVVGAGTTISLSFPTTIFETPKSVKVPAVMSSFAVAQEFVRLPAANSPAPRSSLLGKVKEGLGKQGDKEARNQQELLYRLKTAGHFVAAGEIEGLFAKGVTTHVLHEVGHRRWAAHSSYQHRLATLVNPAERNRALMLLGAASLGAISSEAVVSDFCVVP